MSYVSPDGYVFLQAPSKALDKVRELMESLAPSLDAATAAEAPPNIGDLCCAKFQRDQKWYRAIVEDGKLKGEGKGSVHFLLYCTW